MLAVIDTLRATTTIAALLAHGARSVTAVVSEEEARQRARRQEALLAGEVGGLPPAGFDLGNSPAAAAEHPVRGRDVVLFTTNGTRALCAAAATGGRVIAAAAVNLAACAAFLRSASRVAIVCAGERQGSAFALEDFAVAALLARSLAAAGSPVHVGDGARLGLAVEDALTLLAESEHAEELRRLGLGADVRAAAAVDSLPVVPLVTGWGPGWARLEPA